MKKLFVLLAAITVSYVSQAQFVQEVGVRFGDVSGNNFAVDGLLATGEFSRIHANVSFGDGVGVDAIWDFLYKPVGAEEVLKWYVGAGPSMFIGDPFSLGISGEVGLEYEFNFPMSISADWRPTFVLLENTDFKAGGFGVNVRYVFGQ
ncbi:MAG: outer membrane insertion C- signal [Reichenbachiella sp.]